MRKLLILFTIALTMSLTSSGQAHKPEAFAIRVLNAIKEKDFNEYKKLVVNKKDLEDIFADFQKNERKTKRLQEWKDPSDMLAKDADSIQSAEFRTIVAIGEKLGIDWTQVTFSNIVYKEYKPENSTEKLLDGHINFSSKGKSYVLFGVEALEFGNEYKLNGIIRVQRGSLNEYLDPHSMDDENLK